MTDMTVSREILHQLGGNQFVTMIGANSMVGSSNGLSLRFKAKAREGANALRVDLDASDTYTVVLLRVRAGKLTEIRSTSCIYCDQLRGLFEDWTGLRTSLTNIYGRK